MTILYAVLNKLIPAMVKKMGRGDMTNKVIIEVFNAAMMLAMSTPTLIFYVIFMIALSVLMIASWWKVFKKAGEPGWAAIVPFYNLYIEFKIAFGNGWLFLLTLIPIINIVVTILLPFKLAKAFGKSTAFGLGLLFIPVIFYPLLAFGDASYQN